MYESSLNDFFRFSRISLRTSRPTRSVRASGPIGCLYPRTIAVSISLALATPSASMRIASLPRTTPSLDVANPGTSLTRIVVLPIASPAAVAACIVSSEHESCLISSSNFIIGTGLKKCIPMTFPGRPDAAAISAIDSEEVLVPRMQSSFVIVPRSANILCFKSGISGTASITRSASFTASCMSETACRFAAHAAFCSAVVFPLAMPLSQNASMVFIPRSKPSGNASYRLVCQPA